LTELKLGWLTLITRIQQFGKTVQGPAET